MLAYLASVLAVAAVLAPTGAWAEEGPDEVVTGTREDERGRC